MPLRSAALCNGRLPEQATIPFRAACNGCNRREQRSNAGRQRDGCRVRQPRIAVPGSHHARRGSWRSALATDQETVDGTASRWRRYADLGTRVQDGAARGGSPRPARRSRQARAATSRNGAPGCAPRRGPRGEPAAEHRRGVPGGEKGLRGGRRAADGNRRLSEQLEQQPGGPVRHRCSSTIVGFISAELERAKGFEPSTPTLARLCSTPELHPHP